MDGRKGGNEVVEIRQEGRKGERTETHFGPLLLHPRQLAGIPGESHLGESTNAPQTLDITGRDENEASCKTI